MRMPSPGPTSQGLDGACELAGSRLMRQQLRREQGIPTLSVLLGHTAQAIELWQYWAKILHKTCVIGCASDAPPLLAQPPEVPAMLFHRFDAAARMPLLHELTRRIEANPALAIALVMNSAQFDACLRTLPECHTKALLREGRIDMVTPSPLDVHSTLGAQYAQTLQLLHTLRLSEQLLPAFYATVSIMQCCQQNDFERARSAAELFLFEVLQAMPATANLFALNATCDFTFGAAKAEVDLLATTLNIAIEIDGYYHFQAPENFRVDRRKDFELQTRGYLVLRFLAEDIVTLLEDIVGTIVKAITFKRKPV